MKRAASLTLSFLLFAFITNLPLAFSDDGEPVLDVNDNPVVPGRTYYIRPAIRGPPGGGLELGQTGGLTCSVTVLQDFLEVVNGVPVTFSILDQRVGIIFTGTPLDIVFPVQHTPLCAESPKWLVFVDNDIGKACVGIGGPGNYPGKQTLSGTFNIQKYKAGYKLVFCVSGSPTCLDIGRFDNGEDGRRLILTEHEAFDLVFVPTDSNSGGNIIRSVA